LPELGPFNRKVIVISDRVQATMTEYLDASSRSTTGLQRLDAYTSFAPYFG